MSSISIDPSLIEATPLFPLPLVAMEHFWLWDDVQPHPKHFRILVSFTGTVDVPCLEKAIACAAARHPLLLCTLDLSARSARWVIPMTPAIGWKWNQGTWQDSPFPQAWDLRSESGLRIWAYQDGDSAEMCLEIHHACSDGLGIRQFLRDVFVAYDHFSRFPDKPLKLPALSFERIKQRGDFRRPAPTNDTRPTTTWEKIVGAYHFHFRGPSPIATRRTGWKTGQERAAKGHYYFRHTFDTTETARIEAGQVGAANSFDHGVHQAESEDAESRALNSNYSTLNDVAIAKMMQVLAKWNIEHGSANSNQRLRILVPTDLRSHRDSRLPAANRLGFGFVVSTQGDCKNYPRLLEKVQSQTQAIRNYCLGLDFVEIFAGLAKQPKLGAWLVRRPGCLATAVLTNLGDSFGRYRKLFELVDGRIRIGNLIVEDFTGYPPLRPKTSLGVGMSRCAGRLTMGVIVDSTLFTREQAEQLHDAWIRAWQRSVPFADHRT